MNTVESTESSGPTSYQFDQFLVNRKTRVLRRDGVDVHLTAKVMDILLVFLANPGRVLNKDELIEKVWDAKFVEEGNLARHVSTLRKALGGNAHDHRYIVTVPGRGYRFVADVSTENADRHSTNGNRSVSSASDLQRAHLRQKASVQTLIIVTVAAVSVMAIAAMLVYQREPANAVRSIAVLPFRPINTEKRDELSEIGIAEVLINRISSTKGLYVRPLDSVRRYADLELDPIAAGREQQVDYVLAAHYQIAEGNIRITGQLINVATGAVEEPYSFEKEASSIIAMQDAVADEFKNKLAARFGTGPVIQTKARGTDSDDAYRNYQQAMNLMDQQRPGSTEKARQYLGRAVEIDPNYAKAWAGKAVTDSVVWNSNFALDTGTLYKQSTEAAKRALSLDPNLSEAYTSLCESTFGYDFNLAEAEKNCKRAIDLDPSSSVAHRTYSLLLGSRGRFDEAFSEIRIAMDLDPVSLRNQRALANMLYFARRYDEAIAVYKRLVDLNPDVRMTYMWYIRTLELSGHESEAFEYLIKLLEFDGKENETIERFKTAYASFGWAGAVKERINTELREKHPRYIQLAEFYAKLGDKERAFECLDKTFQQRNWLLMYLGVDARFDPLRNDPRYAALVGRVLRE